jgi:hypothetical protein
MPGEDREHEAFIDEPITPKPGSFDTAAMARGGPGIPRVFTWRDREYHVALVLRTWRTRQPGVGKDRIWLYTRKHFYRIRTTSGQAMTIYFDRKPQWTRDRKPMRWFLYSVAAQQ